MKPLQGIEAVYCNECINALIAAWRNLMETTVTEALQLVRYGKGDTLGLDAIPEIVISQRLTAFDRHGILVTEELEGRYKDRWPSDSDPERQPLMFFSDPTDRSKQLRIFIDTLAKANPLQRIGDLFESIDCAAQWEAMFEAPASITGATSSITCVRKGTIIFSVIFNYIVKTIYVACASGVFSFEVNGYKNASNDNIGLDYILNHGRRVKFPSAHTGCKSAADFQRFVTFLGKTGYRENFNDSMLFVENPDEYIHHKEPGGPSRVLYLSELQTGHGPVGFIMANGEKISEWIHWLAFTKFALDEHGGQALRVFEISIERPWTKEGILMSTSLPYSLFRGKEETGFLDISRLGNFDSPSRFRSMLVVIRSDNERMSHIMQQHCYREVSDLY
ncbi:TPA: hypothetical protein DF272_02860 [Candidatus Falkowbacteria bacterium]|nr:hypothetical protein [Candidatus Falkowbacteria bacterium]